ncbi:TIGR00297 family protein [Methanothermobacter wolfeii]|mgnify:CR=1 FL=1|uniref:TIGR00297 family protein n=1 Tax=Methanothermobacter wolfeii TaxID=145261 RepID=A0A9E7UN77_METWO|nr:MULTISPECIES: TIGR00297 family protein [Methanothermobacter]MDI6701891.1 TIGR00297 family protein [Methanothermobacter wolfeii]MDI6841336.1 TIGR00297 family protein [Methanothermobacter wolfeii]NLM02059.1 TIGR00297 family protein [Methanothermobacter wolfeii]QHN05725.1 TIGR00297 family protein [Methanothermobacter sp. THM-1]UXH31867.1 TIGR00297 family protein [Methanothermobacter wolfeii]
MTDLNIGYVLLCVFIGFLTYQRGALDVWGSLFMVLMGLLIILSAGFNWLILIFIFLILGLVSTKYRHEYKKSIGVFEGTRTAKNVISNGIVPFIMAAFGYYDGFLGGFIGSVATATADTMASEIGVVQTPRLITTLRKVEPGTDGGVSLIGTAAGIAGAGIIGFSAFLLGVCPDPLKSMKIAIIAGTVGCFMDSFLGAVLERRKYLTNEHVNLLATVTGAVIGIILV